MNLKKLFVVGSVLVIAWTTANAELVNGVRQRPNVAKAEKFQADVTYYLFNTKARLFFAGANDWNTRASVADHGYKVKFVVDQMETFPGSYEFTDSVETKKAWLSTFSTADGLAIWVDNATETYRFWDVVEQPDDFVDPAAEGAGVDWAFVTEENYNAWVEAWTPMKDQFNAAAGLLTWIKTAEEKSIDVSDEKAIYANEDATVEALNAAVEAIQTKIKNQLATSATVDNPSDMTASYVNNPGFADGKKTGWTGDDPAFGEGAAEYYQKNFELYQTLKGMPNGVYGVGVQGFYRTSFSGSSYGEWQTDDINCALAKGSSYLYDDAKEVTGTANRISISIAEANMRVISVGGANKRDQNLHLRKKSSGNIQVNMYGGLSLVTNMSKSGSNWVANNMNASSATGDITVSIRSDGYKDNSGNVFTAYYAETVPFVVTKGHNYTFNDWSNLATGTAYDLIRQKNVLNAPLYFGCFYRGDSTSDYKLGNKANYSSFWWLPNMSIRGQSNASVHTQDGYWIRVFNTSDFGVVLK